MNELTNSQTFFSVIASLFDRKEGDMLLFNSGAFWLIFVAFIGVYALIYKRKIQMMLYVAAFSLFFYYLTNGWLFLLLPLTAMYDFWIARQMYSCRRRDKRKIYLISSLCLNIGILFFFKYTNFLIGTFNLLISGNLHPVDLFLPVGISFYTFQSISYILDVYRRKVAPTQSFLKYLFYLSFFPLILAGPIMRAENFFPQIRKENTIGNEVIYGGLWLIIIGLLKKAILADYLAQYNDWVFDAPLTYSGYEGLMAVLGYTAQIYCDFSGYSDISIGMAAIMGFDLGKNFDLPYRSRNISEFWRRWHISLSTWMRDYIYIPLGGNRKGKVRTYINSVITMLIAGLWHGASWMFVLWGGLHGVGLVVHKFSKKWLIHIPDTLPVKFASWLLTFLFVSFLWIFFRSHSFENSTDLIYRIFSDFDFAYFLPFLQTRATWCIFLVLVFVLHFLPLSFYDKIKTQFIRSSWIVKTLIFLILVQLIIQFDNGEIQPFIYFQF